MDKNELRQLQAYLRKTFGNAALRVIPHPSNLEMARVQLGERIVATLSVDDEDGDRSFALEMKLPVQRPALESYVRLLLENDKLCLVPRQKKTDSVELNLGKEFLGVISSDDATGESFTLQMAILDVDLEEF